MFALLSPRLWGIAALVAALAFSHIFAYRKGSAHVHQKWQIATAEANNEARRIEAKRQSIVDAAGVAATKRRWVLVGDSRGAADALERLRNAISVRDLAENSISSANKRADTLEKLLLDGAGVIREMARSCDGHVNDKLLLLEAWPK